MTEQRNNKEWVKAVFLDENGNLLQHMKVSVADKEKLYQITSFLPEKYKFSMRVQTVLDGVISVPKCQTCGKEVNFLNGKWSKFCSTSCIRYDDNSKKIITEKRRNTVRERYGVDSVAHSKQVRKKAEQTNLKRYGGTNPMHSTEVRQKIRDTNMANWGTEYASSHPDVRKKVKDTWLRKYGDHPLRINSVRQKVRDTNRKRYGVDYHTMLNTMHIDPAVIIDEHINQGQTINQLCQKYGVSPSVLTSRIEDAGHSVIKHATISQEEIDISNWLNEVGIYHERNNRDILPLNRKLDFYFPQFNIAIELNGIYWHSYNKKETKLEKEYHKWKTDYCNQKGIQLFHFWDSEWKYQQDIVKSMILSACKQSDKIFARKCEVSEIPKSYAREFLKQNHLQGHNENSIYHVGLFYNKNLVSVMTFGTYRSRNVNKDIELIRFASEKNTTIVGGASKLFSFFVNTYSIDKVLSYSDRRYSVGNVYKMLNFELEKSIGPSEFWTSDCIVLEHARKYRIAGAIEQLVTYQPDLPYYENMFLNGYRRIWDSGHDLYVWKRGT